MKTTITSTSRMALIASSAATLLLCLLGSMSITSTVAADATGVERLPPPYDPAPPGGGTTALRSGSSYEFGKVDVFIDLACPKSAAAWPFLKRVVEDQRHRAQFVFHVLPLSDDPIGFFAAKAVQVILANTSGTYDDVKHFIDWVFRGRDVIFFDGNVDMTLDSRELVTDWAVSSSSMSFTRFHSAMQDPAFDERVLEDLEDRFVLSVERTPTVLLNGVFMMHLDGDRELKDFEVFLQSSGFPSFDDDTSTRSISSSSSSSSSSSRSEMWEQMGREIRESYADMVQRHGEDKLLRQQQQRWEQQPHGSQSSKKPEWHETTSSSAYSATFSPASTFPFPTVAGSPSWGSFSVYDSGTEASSSTRSGSDESSPSSATVASPSSTSPPSWAWPSWPSFVTSLFKGRRDDEQSEGGGWGWGPQVADNRGDAGRPAVSAAALAAKAEASVAAAAAQVVNAAAAKDPKITTTSWGRRDNGVKVRGGFGAAVPARKKAIGGSGLDGDASGWWGDALGDGNTGAAAAGLGGGPAEEEGGGRDVELGSRAGERDLDFHGAVAVADAVAVKH